MKKSIVVALGLAVLSCGSGSSGIPQADACNQASKTVCLKIFGCTDSNSVTVQAFLGSEASCEATVLQSCGSTGFQCSAGQTYHGDKAQTCSDQFNSEDCATLSAEIVVAALQGSSSTAIANVTASLPACSQICTGAGTGTAADAGDGG